MKAPTNAKLCVHPSSLAWHCSLICSAVTMTMPAVPGQRHMVAMVTLFFWPVPASQVY